MNFDLRQLTPPSKFGRRKSIRLRPIKQPLGYELEYRREIRNLIRETAIVVRETIQPRYIEWNKFRDSEGWFAELRMVGSSVGVRMRNTIGNLFRRIAERHTEKWQVEVKRSMSVDISGIIAIEDLQEPINDAVSKNVALITSLETQLLADVERIVMDAKVLGKSWREVSPQIVDRFDVAQSRGDLIARDQMAKINSSFSQIRQEQAGIEKYEWLTSMDERVRDRHIPLNGNVYEWGKPTGAEQGLPPGMPIQCRCVAIAIIESL